MVLQSNLSHNCLVACIVLLFKEKMSSTDLPLSEVCLRYSVSLTNERVRQLMRLVILSSCESW